MITLMYKRKTNSKISFDIYRISDDTVATHMEKEFNIDEIIYRDEKEAIELDGSLTEWADNVSKLKALEVAAIEIGAEVPDDLIITTLYGATFKAENIEGYGIETSEYGRTLEQIKLEIEEYEKQRQQELIKREEKKKKAEIAKAIKVAKQQKEKEEKIEKKIKEEEKISEQLEERGIKYEPKLPPKKELTAIDIAHLSRIQKDITKLEKKKAEQTQFLNIALGAIERIEESGRLDLLLGQVVTRDRFIDAINRTETKIKRQKESIEKIKGI